jgi:hypothetical protein
MDELTGPARKSGRDNRADRSAVSDAIATQPTDEKNSREAWDASPRSAGAPGPRRCRVGIQVTLR